MVAQAGEVGFVGFFLKILRGFYSTGGTGAVPIFRWVSSSSPPRSFPGGLKYHHHAVVLGFIGAQRKVFPVPSGVGRRARLSSLEFSILKTPCL